MKQLWTNVVSSKCGDLSTPGKIKQAFQLEQIHKVFSKYPQHVPVIYRLYYPTSYRISFLVYTVVDDVRDSTLAACLVIRSKIVTLADLHHFLVCNTGSLYMGKQTEQIRL